MREGYNVLALAQVPHPPLFYKGSTVLFQPPLSQHADDLAESFLMSCMHNGRLRTMKANYTSDRGVRVIRPLVYVREMMTRAYADAMLLPVIEDNCPACFKASRVCDV